MEVAVGFSPVAALGLVVALVESGGQPPLLNAHAAGRPDQRRVDAIR
jgi:hypothetical protein